MPRLVVRACLVVFCAIEIIGGSLQMALGQPQTTARLDNVHRFMAGVYLSLGVICGWTAIAVREQGAGNARQSDRGRCVRRRLRAPASMRKVGLPEPKAVWLGYLVPELMLPIVLAVAHFQRP